MKSMYLVLRSFASPIHGNHSEGEVIELADDVAPGLGALVMPVKRDVVEVETAELPVQKAEKAVRKTKKKVSE